MLLLIVTLTLYFNGNEITTHLIHNQIDNKSRKSFFFAWKHFTIVYSSSGFSFEPIINAGSFSLITTEKHCRYLITLMYHDNI